MQPSLAAPFVFFVVLLALCNVAVARPHKMKQPPSRERREAAERAVVAAAAMQATIPDVVDEPVTELESLTNPLITLTDGLADAVSTASDSEPLTLTIEKKDAEAALEQMESVKRGLESLEELLKSAASLTKLKPFREGTAPEPAALLPPPKALSDDPSTKHAPGHGHAHGEHDEEYEEEDLSESHAINAHSGSHHNANELADLYYDAYDANEQFYTADSEDDLREPVPVIPVNPERFRDYSAHPKMTAEEFFGRNRKVRPAHWTAVKTL